VAELGFAFGVVTNGGRPMDDEFFNLLLKADWLRFSIDTVSPEAYLALHRPKNPARDNLEHTLANLQAVLERRTKTMVGASFLIHPGNRDDIVLFAQQMKAAGLDYVEYKPVYLSGQATAMRDFFLSVKPALAEARTLASDHFKVFVLLDRMSDDTFVTRDFGHCRIQYLTAHIGADARVYPCCVLCYAEPFVYGDLHEQTFGEIWSGTTRQGLMHRLTPDTCPRCWSDRANEAMQYLLSDVPHADFI
jgi:radical SAM protein with 4Fe4S-binding SPASM domain